MRLPRNNLSKDNPNRHAKEDRVKHIRPKPYTESYRQLRNVESRRKKSSPGLSYQLVIQYQVVRPVNIHTSHSIQTGNYICNIYVNNYTYMYITTINEKRGHKFESELEGYMRGFGGRKGKEEMMQL